MRRNYGLRARGAGLLLGAMKTLSRLFVAAIVATSFALVPGAAAKEKKTAPKQCETCKAAGKEKCSSEECCKKCQAEEKKTARVIVPGSRIPRPADQVSPHPARIVSRETMQKDGASTPREGLARYPEITFAGSR